LCIEGFIPIDSMEDEPHLAGVLQRIARFSHAIRFNRRGIGLSDRPAADDPPTLERWLDDAEAVLDAVGCPDAIVLGDTGGALIAAGLAALRPNRVRSLVIINGYARFFAGPDHPFGEDRAFIQGVRARLSDPEHPDGPFDVLAHLAPSVAEDIRFRTWWDGAGRRGATPGTMLALREALEQMDLRDSLPNIDTPTLVLQRVGTRALHAEQGRLLARRIVGARYVELPGNDTLWYVGDTDRMLDEIERFVTGEAPRGQASGDVLTVLFSDIVGSTERAARLGDGLWNQLFGRYETAAYQHVSHQGGTYVKSTGDGSLATFDGPVRAVQCAVAWQTEAERLGLQLRCGVHTGRLERRGRDIAGMAVHVAARVLALADAGEILMTSTTADLLQGGPTPVRARGTFPLKGVPGRWALSAVSR
jgi:class 3 adenylate cyclase